MAASRRLAVWYSQLGQSLASGITLIDALRNTYTFHPEDCRRMADSLAGGRQVDDVLKSAPAWLPQSDRLFLSAGHESGKLPQVCEHLKQNHEAAVRLQARLILALLYPLGVLHAAIFLMPVLRMIDWEKGFAWDGGFYLLTLARLLIPLWLTIAGLFFLTRKDSRLLDLLMSLLPGFRGYRRHRTTADLSLSLAMFLDSGIPVGKAWALAGLVCRSEKVRNACWSLSGEVNAGVAPGGQLAGARCFPEDFVALYQAGEQTGHLEENLYRLAKEHADRASNHLTFASLFYPGVILLGVLAIAASQVLMFFQRYYSFIEQMAR